MKRILQLTFYILIIHFSAVAQSNLKADNSIDLKRFKVLLPDVEKRVINLSIDSTISNPEAFYIKSDLKEAIIKASHTDGLLRGFMYLLNNSGIEYGGYSDNWIEINYKPYKTIGKLVEPYVGSLGYFGTGGLGTDQRQKELSLKHHDALGFIGRYVAIPHAFHYFYKQNQKEIDADSTILTDYWAVDKNGNRIAGKRVDPNLDNPKALVVIKNWVYRTIDKNPSVAHVSLGTADGIWSKNVGLPKSIPQIKNLIDKYMWIVNEVAKSVKIDRPNWKGKISYNVYGNGTGVVIPPKFKLENNIFIQLYTAFQRDYKTDVELFKAWHDAHPNLEKQYGDYWNITQWSLGGLPNDNVFAKANRILPLLKENGINNYKIESTHFSIVMNPHWWVLSKYMHGYENKTIDQWYDLYFQTFFKEVAPDVQNLYRYWSTNWAGEASLPFIVQKTDSILKKTRTPIVKDRMVELISYVHYLVLYYETKNAYDTASAERLENYAAKVNDLGTLQSWAIYRYDYGDVKPYGFGGSKTAWKDYKKSNPFNWDELKTYLLSEFSKDVKSYPIAFDVFPYEKEKLAIKAVTAVSRVFKTYRSSPLSFKFNVDSVKDLSFNWTPTNPGDKLRFTDDDLSDTTLVADGKMVDKKQEFNVRVQPGRNYTVSFVPKLNSAISKIELPDNIAFKRNGGSLASGNGINNWWFYVPKNCDHIIFKPNMEYNTTKGKYVALQKPDGNLAIPAKEIAKNVYRIDIDKKDRGKVWRVYTRTDKWSFLNIDPILSTIPFEVRDKE